MRHQRALDLGRAEAVPGDVQHVVHAARDPVVTVLVALRAVTGEVPAGEGLEIRVDEALVVAEHGAHLARPAVFDDEVALAGAIELLALVVDDRGLHAEERQRSRARLEVDGTRQRRDQDAAGLGLPPGVDDRAAVVADHTVIPLPGLGVDRLSDGAEQAQRAARVFLHRRVTLAHQRAQRRGRGIEERHLVLVADFPEPPDVGVVRHALEHERGGAVRKRAVHDVAVPRNPAHVRRAPEDVVFLQVEHTLVRQRGVHEITAGRVQHAFRLAGGPGGVEDEQRVLRIHDLRFAFLRLAVHELGVPAVAVVHGDGRARALHHQHVFYRLRALGGEGLVDVRLERHALAAAQPFVRGDHEIGCAVGDAPGERVR